MKLRDLYNHTYSIIKESGSPSARLDTDLIFQFILKFTSVQLITNDQQNLTDAEQAGIEAATERRCSGEPIAYITGTKEFFGYPFKVGPGVLVPRPETEHLVEEGIMFLKGRQRPSIADFGAGSGCLGLSILNMNQEAELISIEKSPEAVEYLKENLSSFDLSGRTKVLEQDVASVCFLQSFDLIVANPPYISLSDSEVHPWVRLHEPSLALFSSEDGYADVKSWIKIGVPLLKSGGMMLVEIGAGQGPKLLTWLEQSFTKLDVTLGQDLAGLDRFLKLVNT